MHGKENFNMCNFTLNIIFRVSIKVSTSGFFFFLQKKESPMFWANLLFTCGWRWTWTSHPPAFFPQVKDQSEWMLLCPVCVCIFNERIIPSSQQMFILVCFACWFLYWVIPQHSPWFNELFMPPFWVYVLPLCEYF